ncbi:MAG: hypothetical protein JW750_02790, partial [Anaerolineaceae bacterium]|nr:hypothetical protein [Anaerolineaceae bacterium]
RRVLAGNPFADGELPLSQVNQICANTTMIILTVHAQADEWRQQIIQFRQNAIDANFPHDQAFFDAVLAVLAGQEVSLPEHPLYRAAITEMQENIKSGDQPAVISSEQLDTIVQRTVQAVHGSEHDRSVWHDVIQDALRKARSLKQSKDADFFENLLRVLGGGKPNLPKDHPYRDALQRVIVGIRVGLPVSTESLPAEQLKRIAANTVLVMKDHPEEWDAWHEMISDVLRQAREAQLGKDAAFFQAILNLLEHKEVSLDEQNPYHPILHAIQQALKD